MESAERMPSYNICCPTYLPVGMDARDENAALLLGPHPEGRTQVLVLHRLCHDKRVGQTDRQEADRRQAGRSTMKNCAHISVTPQGRGWWCC